MKPRILVVAHDLALRATLARWLIAAGYAVELAEGPKRAREVVAGNGAALAIVAPDRLGEAGLNLAQELGEATGRLIIVAERPDEIGSWTGSAAGGCLVKPLDEEEVLARVSAALGSQSDRVEPVAPEILHFQEFTLDIDARTLRDTSGKEVALTRSEFELLRAFARRPGRVLSRDELRHAVAGRGTDGDRSVDVLVLRLRRKIEPDASEPRIIVTAPGVGYKFTAKPQAVQPAVEGTAGPSPSIGPAGQDTLTLMTPAARPAVPLAALHAGLQRGTIVITALLCGLAVGGALLRWQPQPEAKPVVAVSSTAAEVSDLVWQAGEIWNNQRRSTATVVQVRELLERATAHDENNLEANAQLGAVLTAGVLNGWSSNSSADLATADAALKRVLQRDPTHRRGLMSRCEWLRAKYQFEEALRACQEALARYPDSASALKEIGYDKIALGRAEEALELFAEADKLAPNSPERWTWLQGGGHACLMLGRHGEAIAWLRRAVEEPGGSGRAYAWLAAAYALSGRDEEARAALREFRRIRPAATVTGAYFRLRGSPRAREQMQQVLEGLRLAGLPE